MILEHRHMTLHECLRYLIFYTCSVLDQMKRTKVISHWSDLWITTLPGPCPPSLGTSSRLVPKLETISHQRLAGEWEGKVEEGEG